MEAGSVRKSAMPLPAANSAATAEELPVPRGRRAIRALRIPGWFWLVFAICVGANRIAAYAAVASIAAMANVSDFAETVRAHNVQWIPLWQGIVYPTIIAILMLYIRPLLAYFQDGCPQEAPQVVQRRAVSAPLAFAAAGFCGWLFSVPLFMGITFATFGRWTPELASQHLFSPIINGYLAAVLSYFAVDAVFRMSVYPRVFPHGRLADVPGTFRLGVRGRVAVLMTALSFIPMFIMLGLARAAAVRWERGLDPRELLSELTRASEATFAVYVLAGMGLAMIVTRSLTAPLEFMATALQRVQRGDLNVRIPVSSADEVGTLEDGVNDLVAALRDRERILQTFGRVVEPSVRDRLLSGRVERGGERRRATVLFCDLRGFTSLSEQHGAEEAVETLNDFFAVITAWVHECGGFVDKFIGDAVLVVFGLFDDEQEAKRSGYGAVAAVRCACGIKERLSDLNERRRRAGKPPLAVTNAVHTGEVVAGVIGSADRHEYTVVGDTVNVAARLQVAAKDHGGTVISEATCALVRQSGQELDVARSELITLRGRNEPVSVYFLKDLPAA
ncbi:MAG TPA: adenylate/guanylate cyclase domain-containing protein [Candidatus Limnocylindrales bacterium]|nr:adenylate/guanylate cyclase domain-containing protein [Candidatus Limnocylindrales bacterium]